LWDPPRRLYELLPSGGPSTKRDPLTPYKGCPPPSATINAPKKTLPPLFFKRPGPPTAKGTLFANVGSPPKKGGDTPTKNPPLDLDGRSLHQEKTKPEQKKSLCSVSSCGKCRKAHPLSPKKRIPPPEGGEIGKNKKHFSEGGKEGGALGRFVFYSLFFKRKTAFGCSKDGLLRSSSFFSKKRRGDFPRKFYIQVHSS